MSDHLPFARRGVPALVVTTAGEHPDYHTVRDTPDRLRPAGIENATRLCALAVWREANRDEMNRGARRVPFLRDAREGQPRHCVLAPPTPDAPQREVDFVSFLQDGSARR
jgi:hypothetical protein